MLPSVIMPCLFRKQFLFHCTNFTRKQKNCGCSCFCFDHNIHKKTYGSEQCCYQTDVEREKHSNNRRQIGEEPNNSRFFEEHSDAKLHRKTTFSRRCGENTKQNQHNKKLQDQSNSSLSQQTITLLIKVTHKRSNLGMFQWGKESTNALWIATQHKLWRKKA